MNFWTGRSFKEHWSADFCLESERFAMRPAAEGDLGAIAKILADPNVTKTLLGDVSTPQGVVKEARKWVDDESFWLRHGFGSWGIFDKASALSNAEGLIGIAAASPPLGEWGEGPEIFYFVRRDCWGKGVAGEAAARMCRYLFERRQAPALEASIFAELNPGSVRLAERLGMHPSGRVSLRDHGLDDDRLEEVVTFELWRVRNAAPETLQGSLAEAAFRIGQTLAEGLGTVHGRKSDLLVALAAREQDGDDAVWAATRRIERLISRGIDGKGLALYRIRRGAANRPFG